MKRALLFLLAGWVASIRAEVRYTIVQVESGSNAPATYSSFGTGINNRGVVVGYFDFPDPSGEHPFEYRPFRFNADEGMRAMGSAGSWVTVADDINDAGQIVGFVGEPIFRGFRYTEGPGYLFINGSEANGINNRGQVTGYAGNAFRYTDGVGQEDLGSLYGGGSQGWAINDRGWVTGNSDGFNAFLYRDDLGLTYLGPGRGLGINDQGTVVGEWWGLPAASYSAVVWMSGEARLLGTFGGVESSAFAINNKNQVAGYSAVQSGSWHGFIWTEEEGMQDLNALVPANSGWFLGTGYDINDHGWIVGDGYYRGKSQAYLLVPISPTLQIALAGANVVITWSPHWPRLVLETASYHSPTNWQAVPGGANDPVILPATGPGQVFRLTQHDSLDPKLAATVSGTNLVISWAPPWPDYTLESASTLPAASWERVPGATNSPVTLPLSLGPRFFRLRK